MTNEEILARILDIDLEGISECILELFGDEHKDKVLEKLNNTTFYGVGSIYSAIDCVKTVWDNLKEQVEKLTSENRLEDVRKTKEKILSIMEVYYFLLDIKKEQEKIDRDWEENKEEEIDKLISSFPNKTQYTLRYSENYKQRLIDFINFSDPNNLSLTASYQQFFEDIFWPDYQTSQPLEEYPHFKNIVDLIKTLNEKESLNILDPINKASIKRITKAYKIKNPTKQDLENFEKKYLNLFETMPNWGGTCSSVFDYDLNLINIIGFRLNRKPSDHTIIHEIIHSIFSFINDRRCTTGFAHKYKYFNEIVTEWLATLVTLLYHEKYPAHLGTNIDSKYQTSATSILNFLMSNYNELIKCLMENDIDSFIELVGEDVIARMDKIFKRNITLDSNRKKTAEELEDDEWLKHIEMESAIKNQKIYS